MLDIVIKRKDLGGKCSQRWNEQIEFKTTGRSLGFAAANSALQTLLILRKRQMPRNSINSQTNFLDIQTDRLNSQTDRRANSEPSLTGLNT